jgi:hypothetical protein
MQSGCGTRRRPERGVAEGRVGTGRGLRLDGHGMRKAVLTSHTTSSFGQVQERRRTVISWQKTPLGDRRGMAWTRHMPGAAPSSTIPTIPTYLPPQPPAVRSAATSYPRAHLWDDITGSFHGHHVPWTELHCSQVAGIVQ